MMSSQIVLNYAKSQVSDTSSPYPFAFGYVWASLSETQQKKIIKDCRDAMVELEVK